MTAGAMALRRSGDTGGMSTPISLGMPASPPPVLAPRRPTRKIKVGKVEVGGDAPISVQSMTTTPTTDINATLQQIAELTATGCDIVRPVTLRG
jgi:(E)-4-hydroxy-3-methylbut-2-enyl-diphosphate synthase